MRRIVKINKKYAGPYDPRKTSLQKCEFLLFFQTFRHFSCKLPARVGEKFIRWSLNLSRNIEPKRLLFRTSLLEFITATQANIGQESRQKKRAVFFPPINHSAQHSVQLFGAHVLPSCLLHRFALLLSFFFFFVFFAVEVLFLLPSNKKTKVKMRIKAKKTNSVSENAIRSSYFVFQSRKVMHLSRSTLSMKRMTLLHGYIGNLEGVHTGRKLSAPKAF